MSPQRFLSRLRRDERGITVVEFAIVAPVMGLMLLGGFDVAHTLYMRGVLQGVVQKAARDSTLENAGASGTQTALDDRVRAQVKAIARNGTITISRRYYRTFTAAAVQQPENWTDTDHNGTCDHGEPYEDANLNNLWDRDGANGGQGGAKDAVIYTVSVSYPRFFPVNNFIGGSNTTTVKASTVLRNQPYGDQATYGTMIVKNCT